jgi:transcriptional regulator with XRE-family HTH domain
MGKKPRTPRRAPEVQAIFNEFARRLQAAMARKGWSQSELARRANALMPTPAPGQKQGHDFRRDQVSHYVCGRHLPSPQSLAVLARALDIAPSELMPQGALAGDLPPQPSAANSVTLAAASFSLVERPDGRADLQIARTVSMRTALAIANLLHEDLDGSQ